MTTINHFEINEGMSDPADDDSKVNHHATARDVQQALMIAAKNDSWRIYNGPQCEKLRAQLASHFGRQYVRLCNSGTIAVELALRSLHLQAPDEVILAGYDYPGNFRAILDAGANVRLCDLQPDVWTVNVEQLEKIVSSQTRAIIVSHLHGTLAPMHQLWNWARKRGIVVIEDACQEPGAHIFDIGKTAYGIAGGLGDISVISFGGSKLLTAGRGGAVLTNDARYAQRMTIFCERGNDAFALSELQATVLIPQLSHLEADNATRRDAATALRNQLESFAWLNIPTAAHHEQASYYKFGLSLDPSSCNKDRLGIPSTVEPMGISPVESLRSLVIARLQQREVPVGVGFGGFLHRSRRRCWREGKYENTERMSKATMVLHHSVLLDPITGESRVAQVVNAFQAIQQEFFS